MVRERRASRPRPRQRPQPKPAGSIWDTPHIKKLLAQPFGAPIDLAREEALAILNDPPKNRRKYRDGAKWVREIRKESGAILVRPDKDD